MGVCWEVSQADPILYFNAMPTAAMTMTYLSTYSGDLAASQVSESCAPTLPPFTHLLFSSCQSPTTPPFPVLRLGVVWCGMVWFGIVWCGGCCWLPAAAAAAAQPRELWLAPRDAVGAGDHINARTGDRCNGLHCGSTKGTVTANRDTSLLPRNRAISCTLLCCI